MGPITALLALSFVVLSSSTSFNMALDVSEQFCLYEVLQPQQKYSVEVRPLQEGTYEFELGVKLQEEDWEVLQQKTSSNHFEQISYHKLASHDGTYSFCFKNLANQELKLHAEIRSGIELMDFELLPEKSDAENLQRQLSWLQNQKRKLFESLERMEGLKATSEGLSNLMTKKMIGFAILGLLMLVVVNLLFYREIKKTLKDRKII